MTGTEPGTRTRVLGLLRESGRGLSAAEIAGRLGIHPNTVRFHLDALIDRGRAERVPAAPSGRGRPPVRVRAVAGMDPSGPRHYRMLAEALLAGLTEAETPDPAARPGATPAALAERAGHTWGGRLVAAEGPGAGADPLTVLTRMLGELDFEPERVGLGIGLRNCPFLELTGSTREVVCSVHLGLMRGVLDALGSEVAVARLEPFVRPDLCMTHLTGPPLSA